MLARYVWADLVRNPRRTLSAMVGVTLGVGLFCGVLFFVDGLSASMTARAVAPLPIDMQLVVTQPLGASLTLKQSISSAAQGEASVTLDIVNTGQVAAHDVIVRSAPVQGLAFVAHTAVKDGRPIVGDEANPFFHGSAQTGLNVGTLAPGATHRLGYRVRATAPLDADAVVSTYSSRENPIPAKANAAATADLQTLASRISALDGIDTATPLSLADLGVGRLAGPAGSAPGPAKIFGFDAAYTAQDDTIVLLAGRLSPTGAVISAEAAKVLRLAPGGLVSIRLPDGSAVELEVTGVADLSRARSLFSSRRGGDLETFVYTAQSVVVSPTTFDAVVQPAFDRAAASGAGRIKAPPLHEVDIALDRARLAFDPATARVETSRTGGDVVAVAGGADYLLDNISNTLGVAATDAAVAKRLFVFLGVPGALLAAMLAAYAGSVLAETQRREQAMLRVRGASRRQLLRMLALRTAALTGAGAVLGLASGYLVAVAVLGRASLERANPSSLATSAVLGTFGGFAATGLALYVTGRRAIDREIQGDRARYDGSIPVWRRARLDILGLLILAVGTALAIRADAFAGSPGSVYFGRGVTLNLALLVLPVAVWISGGLLGARLLGGLLGRTQPRSSPALRRPLPSLYRLSIGRRPWAIGTGALVVSLIVGLATCLAAFTSSYDTAKARDARYALGADLRVTPGPASGRTYTAADTAAFATTGVAGSTPVIFAVSNVILRSARTSDPANLAAVDPSSYPAIADPSASQLPAEAMRTLRDDPNSVLVNAGMAAFLKAKVGDTLHVVLARGTAAQVEVPLRIAAFFDRLPGFPDGADAVMSLTRHSAAVPSKHPDFFLLATDKGDSRGLGTALTSLRTSGLDGVQVDTRASTLAQDQSSLAALNIAGLVKLDSGFALAMAVTTIFVFVFGLLLSRRREYVTLRAQGLEPSTLRQLIVLEAGTVAVAGSLAGVLVGAAMGVYFVKVLRPLFVLTPSYHVPVGTVAAMVSLVVLASLASAVAASRIVNGLEPTELLRDE